MYVFLNSNDAATTDNQVIRWNLNSYQTKSRRAKSIQLLSVQFPNSVYPINGNNNVVTMSQDGVTATVTIPPGVYSGTTLATELKSLFDGASFAQTYTVTYNVAQQNLTITPSSGTFAIAVGAISDAAYNLGVTVSQAGVEASVFTTGNPLNIGGTIFVDVHSNLGIDHLSSTTSGRLLCRIPVKVDFGEIVFWEPPVPLIMDMLNSDFDYLELRLFDDRGNPHIPPFEHSKISFSFSISYQ